MPMETIKNPSVEDFNKIFKINVPLKGLLKMDRSVLEGFYKIGYHYNRGGDPLRAMRYFRLLCMLDPLNPKYSLALAMGLHHLKQYKEAAMMYLLTAAHDPKNPIPWFYLSDCYFRTKSISEGIGALNIVVAIVDEDSEHLYLKRRAEIILKNNDYENLFETTNEETLAWEEEKEE